MRSVLRGRSPLRQRRAEAEHVFEAELDVGLRELALRPTHRAEKQIRTRDGVFSELRLRCRDGDQRLLCRPVGNEAGEIPGSCSTP